MATPRGPCQWCNKSLEATKSTPFRLCAECYQSIQLAPSKPQLCQSCKELFTSDDGFLLSEVQEYDVDLGANVRAPNVFSHQPELGTSAEVGCPLCRIFMLQDPNPNEARHYGDHWESIFLQSMVRRGTTFANTDNPKEDSRLGPDDIDGFYFESEPGQYRLTFSVFALEDDPSSQYISQRPPEKYLGSISTIKQVKSWLTECLMNHEECNSLSTAELPPLPTRAIDVGSEDTCRIVESLGSPRHGEYVTLSYCWGREPFLTTTSQNIESFKNELPLSTLPQTFKDAITTTRALGYRYLWIDALCILQDSSGDKAREINRMGDIYHNATLTIASVGATKVADGFLTPKSRLEVTLPYKCPDGQIGSVQVSPQKVVDLHTEILYTRAWCMQENLLTPRMLIYTDDEVLWQCQSDHIKRPDTRHVSYELDNPSMPNSVFLRLSPDLFSPGQLRAGSKVLQPQDFYFKWTSLVSAYSRRRLSVLSDRLPAIAGIAAQFQTASGNDTYYAGHWESLFIPLLTWHRSIRRPIPAYIPLNKYRAPSWSWASMEGPVEFEIDAQDYDVVNTGGLRAKFVYCAVLPVSQMAPLQEVRSGSVVINASMLRAIDFPDENQIFVPGISLDIPSDLKQASQEARMNNTGDYLSEEQWEKGWFMLLGARRIGPKNKATNTTALILMPVDGIDTFRRIGFFETSMTGASKEWSKAKDRRTITII